jgi:hypothetical protein
MRTKKQTSAGRDWLHRLHERRAVKLMALDAGTPEDERRWARAAGLPVAELRARAIAHRTSPSPHG